MPDTAVGDVDFMLELFDRENSVVFELFEERFGGEESFHKEAVGV
jgi:hypothetical protein